MTQHPLLERLKNNSNYSLTRDTLYVAFQQKLTLVSSGNNSICVETVRKCKECGMNDIVSKPMSAETLKRIVESNRKETNVIER